MKVEPPLIEGSFGRQWVELAVRVWRLKREVARAFGFEIGPWMTYRRLENRP